METIKKLLREANFVKKAGGDLYPLYELTGSLQIVCDTIATLIYDERVYELLDEESEDEYEVAKEELKAVADILYSEIHDP